MLRIGCLAAFGLALPLLAANQAPASQPGPGTINFVEGRVFMDGTPVESSSMGKSVLKPGSTLRTEGGKVELLLTPGVFLRVGDESQVRLLSAGLTDTRVAMDKGSAFVQAAQMFDENNISLADDKLTATIEKRGLYAMNADRSSFSVYDGKAEVRQDDSKVELKKGKQVTASDVELKAEKFDLKEAKKVDSLYQWSNLRSKYLDAAAQASAPRVVSSWAWNPWYGYSWYSSPFYGSGLYGSPYGYGYGYGVPRYRIMVPRRSIGVRPYSHQRGPGAIRSRR